MSFSYNFMADAANIAANRLFSSSVSTPPVGAVNFALIWYVSLPPFMGAFGVFQQNEFCAVFSRTFRGTGGG